MDHTITCKKCGEKHTPSKMRYLQDGKTLVCINCVRKMREAKEQKPAHVPPAQRKKTRFKCTKCKHIFSIKDGFPKQCPYCSSFSLVSQEWNSDLDNLIKDAGQKIYDN